MLLCSHRLYLITAICFSPYFGPSSSSFIKYICHYWNILMWIHISVNHIILITYAILLKLQKFKFIFLVKQNTVLFLRTVGGVYLPGFSFMFYMRSGCYAHITLFLIVFFMCVFPLDFLNVMSWLCYFSLRACCTLLITWTFVLCCSCLWFWCRLHNIIAHNIMQILKAMQWLFLLAQLFQLSGVEADTQAASWPYRFPFNFLKIRKVGFKN